MIWRRVQVTTGAYKCEGDMSVIINNKGHGYWGYGALDAFLRIQKLMYLRKSERLLSYYLGNSVSMDEVGFGKVIGSNLRIILFINPGVYYKDKGVFCHTDMRTLVRIIESYQGDGLEWYPDIFGSMEECREWVMDRIKEDFRV